MFPRIKSLSQEFYRERFALRSRLLRQRRSGISVILIVLATFVILGSAGLAVDYALLVNDKNQSQRACDAAALAGAQELPTDTAKATSVAIAVAGQNGVSITSSNVSFLDDNSKIRVVAQRSRSLFFMNVLGIGSKNVRTSAIASKTLGSSSPPTVVPIGVTETTVDAYTKPTVKSDPVYLTLPRVQSENYGMDKFLVFDLRPGGKSAPHMKDQLINGYTETKIGDMLTSLNASVEGAPLTNFEEALANRFQRAAQAPWLDIWTGNLLTSSGIRFDEILAGKARGDNPRVMNLIVNHEAGPENGTTKHEVLGFVPVYIQGWSNSQLVIRFLPTGFSTGGSGSSGSKVSLIE